MLVVYILMSPMNTFIFVQIHSRKLESMVRSFVFEFYWLICGPDENRITR